MSVPVERIKPGATFVFPKGDRKVVRVRSGSVSWIYADGKKRNGRIGGCQWLKYFRQNAGEEILVEAGEDTGLRQLKDGETVAETEATTTLSIHTHCPEKWLMVDRETGQTWMHNGKSFLPAPDAVKEFWIKQE